MSSSGGDSRFHGWSRWAVSNACKRSYNNPTNNKKTAHRNHKHVCDCRHLKGTGLLMSCPFACTHTHTALRMEDYEDCSPVMGHPDYGSFLSVVIYRAHTHTRSLTLFMHPCELRTHMCLGHRIVSSRMRKIRGRVY